MIDFIKIHYKDKSILEEFVLDENNFKEVITSYEYHTDEIRRPIKVGIHNVEVVVNEETGYVRASLHKFNNIIKGKGKQNHNDFSYSDLCFVIDYLCENIVDLKTADITQLEFGLNINTDIPAEYIIRDNILMHNLKTHNHNKRFKGKGEYKQFDYTNYYIKIYDKAKQFNRYENILRFEIKFIRKAEFNKLNIKHIEDLKTKSNLESLFGYLIKRYEQLTIIDLLDKSRIEEKDYALIELYSNERFWSNIPREKRNQKTSYKKNFNRLLEKYNLLTTKQNIHNLLVSKFQYLINN